VEGGKVGDSCFLCLVSLLVVAFYAIFDFWESDDLVMFQVLKKGRICDGVTDFPMLLQLTHIEDGF